MNAFTKLYAILSVFEARLEERRDEKGITAIEYALMAGALATIVVAGTQILGPKINGLFSGISL